jgi:hypothetical protein
MGRTPGCTGKLSDSWPLPRLLGDAGRRPGEMEMDAGLNRRYWTRWGMSALGQKRSFGQPPHSVKWGHRLVTRSQGANRALILASRVRFRSGLGSQTPRSHQPRLGVGTPRASASCGWLIPKARRVRPINSAKVAAGGRGSYPRKQMILGTLR